MRIMIREITLKDWERFGEGAQADAYNCISDQGLMLKLYNEKTPEGLAAKHMKVTESIQKLGLKTPSVYELVTCEGRQGIIFERLQNKKSLNRIMADDPAKIEACAELFAGTLKMIHGTEVDTSVFPARSQLMKGLMTAAHQNKVINDAQYERVMASMEGTDVNRAVFGDANGGNMVLSNGELYIIDIGSFSYGVAEYDLGMFFASHTGAIKKEFFEELSHMPFENCLKFYKHVMQNYLGTTDEEEIRAYEEKLRPFGAVIPVGLKMYQGIGAEADGNKLEEFLGK